MQPPDIPQVVAIDQQSFNPPWTARSYSYEISESTYSHMVVLQEGIVEAPRGFWQRLLGTPPPPVAKVLGYGGLWTIQDEAHISTIASHPELRGQGLGELLLAGMIVKALKMAAAYLVLEVRVGNTTAQNLYRKYEFDIFDRKKGYYHSDGEDAYDMRLDLTNPDIIARTHARYAAVQQRIPFVDAYTSTSRYR
jgi:ribosomal-protein-alanine N-acetyltransferase